MRRLAMRCVIGIREGIGKPALWARRLEAGT
jgi:hypothetical protein